MDSKVANCVLQTVGAAPLMGAHVIVTGLSTEVAQSLSAIGIDLSNVETSGDLQGGIEQRMDLLRDPAGYGEASLTQLSGNGRP